MPICFGNFFHPLHCIKAFWNPRIKYHHSARVKNAIIYCQITVQTENQHPLHGYHNEPSLCEMEFSAAHLFSSVSLCSWWKTKNAELKGRLSIQIKYIIQHRHGKLNMIFSVSPDLFRITPFPFLVCFPVNPDASQRTQELYCFPNGNCLPVVLGRHSFAWFMWDYDPWSINQAFLVLEEVCLRKTSPTIWYHWL